MPFFKNHNKVYSQRRKDFQEQAKSGGFFSPSAQEIWQCLEFLGKIGPARAQADLPPWGTYGRFSFLSFFFCNLFSSPQVSENQQQMASSKLCGTDGIANSPHGGVGLSCREQWPWNDLLKPIARKSTQTTFNNEPFLGLLVATIRKSRPF